jgi:hypothetical protein
MVSFTAGATTTKPEQKQKTEFIKGVTTQINAVSVENHYQVVFVNTDAKIKTEFKVKSFEVNKPITSEATNDDVGWKVSKKNYTNYSKSNLSETNRIPIVSLCHKTKTRIRSDC